MYTSPPVLAVNVPAMVLTRLAVPEPISPVPLTKFTLVPEIEPDVVEILPEPVAVKFVVPAVTPPLTAMPALLPDVVRSNVLLKPAEDVPRVRLPL
jgi:hypothetical protein